MPWYHYFWTDERTEKLTEHGITIEEFEQIVGHPESAGRSRSHPQRRLAWGYTDDGRYVVCVYELLDDRLTVIPITAFEAREPRA